MALTTRPPALFLPSRQLTPRYDCSPMRPKRIWLWRIIDIVTGLRWRPGRNRDRTSHATERSKNVRVERLYRPPTRSLARVDAQSGARAGAGSKQHFRPPADFPEL